MCGRIALGLGADELEDRLNRELSEEQPEEEEEEEEEEENELPPLNNNNNNRQVQPRQQQQQQEDQDQDEQADNEQLDGTGNQIQAKKLSNQPKPISSLNSNSSASSSKSVKKTLAWSSTITKERFRPRYNVAPQSYSVCIRETPTPSKNSSPYQIELFKFGLLPSYLKEPPRIPLQTINCRDDTLSQPTGSPWATQRDKKRAVILAQGFFEWESKQNGKVKLPHFTKTKDDKLMYMAGLWDQVDYPDFESVSSFTIITTSSSKQLKFLHNRMPAILRSKEEVKLWLDCSLPFEKVKHLIRPYTDMLTCYKVPLEVGSVKNDSEEFIRPVSERKGNIGAMFAKQSPSKPIASGSGSSSSSPIKPKIKSNPSPPPSSSISANQDMRLNSDQIDEAQIIETGEVSNKDKGKGKRKATTEVIEISDSDEEDIKSKGKEKKKAKDQIKSSPVSSKKVKVKSSTQTTEKGDLTLGNFFKKA